MTKEDVAKYLVELYGDYERLCSKYGYSTSQKYSEAVGLAIMALTNIKD